MTSCSGFTTCILTNNWLDDTTQRSSQAQLMCDLRPHFDFLIESCRTGMAKPDPQIYKFMLDTLKASPNEVHSRCFLSLTGKECSRDTAKKKNRGVSRLGISRAWQEGSRSSGRFHFSQARTSKGLLPISSRKFYQK